MPELVDGEGIDRNDILGVGGFIMDHIPVVMVKFITKLRSKPVFRRPVGIGGCDQGFDDFIARVYRNLFGIGIVEDIDVVVSARRSLVFSILIAIVSLGREGRLHIKLEVL